jgi:O-antigen ligase
MAGIAATCPVSIFAAQSVGLSLAVLVFLVRLARGRARLERNPLDGPILAFCVWTLLSAAFSPDPLTSHENAKKLVLFALFYLSVEALTPERDRERILDAALLGGLALSAGVLLEYYFLGFDTLANRPHSFLGHYMTASGLVMAVLVVAAARLAFHRGPLPRPSAPDLRVLAVLFGALAIMTALQSSDLFAEEAKRLLVAGLAACGAWMALSRTRNAWLGTLVGLGLIAILRAPKLLWGLAAAVAAVLILRPAPIVGRLTVFDASSVDRYYMWQAGIDMIRDKPVFGQGPGRILAVYPEYRWPQAPNALQPHLHDNALQIAAERGLPCLVWWLWFVAAAMGDAWREVRRGAGWPAVAALAFLAAFMAAGLFEYNFGDSEILMFTLLVAALPYALRRQRTGAAAAA